MATKEIYCYRILKAYSLVVDFDGEVDRVNVPAPVEGETFKQWKKRVLGPHASNVTVLVPSDPAPQMKISTLQEKSGAEHLVRIFRAYGREKDVKKSAAIEDAVRMKEHQLTTLPLNVLHDILAETEHELEPSVSEFFQRFDEGFEDDVDVETLIEGLVQAYNNAVRFIRQKDEALSPSNAGPR